MYGVSKIKSEQNIMLCAFSDLNSKSHSMAKQLELFAENNIVVDMICQSAPKGDRIDFSFTTSYSSFNTVLKVIAAHKGSAPFLSGGFTKINLYGEEMVTTCGVAAKALNCLSKAEIEVFMITTSDLDISVLVREEQEDTAIDALKKTFEI